MLVVDVYANSDCVAVLWGRKTTVCVRGCIDIFTLGAILKWRFLCLLIMSVEGSDVGFVCFRWANDCGRICEGILGG